VPQPATSVVVRTYMAHHQGLSLVALANALHERSMQRRFHAEPMIQATELLLQERAVRFADAPPMIDADVPATEPLEQQPVYERRILGVATPTPATIYFQTGITRC
jgi:cyclic beta-1,2-glucan synthetase